MTGEPPEVWEDEEFSKAFVGTKEAAELLGIQPVSLRQILRRQADTGNEGPVPAPIGRVSGYLWRREDLEDPEVLKKWHTRPGPGRPRRTPPQHS